jgi:hypothetical protein
VDCSARNRMTRAAPGANFWKKIPEKEWLAGIPGCSHRLDDANLTLRSAVAPKIWCPAEVEHKEFSCLTACIVTFTLNGPDGPLLFLNAI